MWKAQGAEAGAIASNLIVSCDRNGTKPCAARPLRARKRRRRSTRAPADAEVRALARFRSRDAQPLRACGLRFLAISSYGHSGSDDASHGRMAPSRSGLRPAGSGDRMDRVNCPVPRSAPRRPRRSASSSGMNTAVPHDRGKAPQIASPRSEEPAQNRRATAQGALPHVPCGRIFKIISFGRNGLPEPIHKNALFSRNSRGEPLSRLCISSSRTLFLPAQLRS